jgi:hypothetical protein
VAEAGRSGRRIQRWVLAILDDGSACPHWLLSRVPLALALRLRFNLLWGNAD